MKSRRILSWLEVEERPAASIAGSTSGVDGQIVGWSDLPVSGAAGFVERILKGEKPADLAVQAPRWPTSRAKTLGLVNGGRAGAASALNRVSSKAETGINRHNSTEHPETSRDSRY